MSFVERHGLWSAEQKEAAQRLRAIAEERKLETIRIGFADQHGILRGKTLIASEALASLENGCSITTTMLAKDTSHKTVFPVFTAGGGFGMKEMEGAADALMIPDPTTFRVLPWSPTSGWVLCDIHFADGRPVPFSTRQLYRSVLSKLGERGYDFVAGLEVEFHLFKLEDAHMAPEDAGQPGRPPSVSLLSHGYQYLAEQRFDQIEPALDIIRRDVLALGLPLRSVEVEFGPSQCEFTFQPRKGIEAADNMVLFRSAVKQIARRHRSYSLAPDRAIWGRDNRGVMIRVLGGTNDPATRLENRIGEPAANPYLYMASQILSGLDGVDRKLDPPLSADTPYETGADPLPKSLREAVFALNDDPFFRQALGKEFVDYYVHIKNAEIEGFQAEVSDWEHREYFEMF